MKYACLIYVDEKESAPPGTPEFGESMAAYMAFGQRNASAILGGEPLQPSITATCVQVRDDRTVTTDGPFAETKEQLGGFYLIEAADLDAAIAIAAQIPGALHGTVEVRPVPDMG